MSGCIMLLWLPSVSRKTTYSPTPGIAIGSPITSPPAERTRCIAARMSGTPITTDGCCIGQSALKGNRPPLIDPSAASGGMVGRAPAGAVFTST